MSLTPGTRIGPYEVLSALGAGAMEEVYRARDTTLGRDVALKLLPAQFASDPDRLARLVREARLLAALNHPNVATINGFEESDGDTRVSTEGGAQARWNRNGKELFYVAEDDALMAVPIGFSPDQKAVEPGTPLKLFVTNVGSTPTLKYRQQYMVSPDGQSFVMNSVAGEASASPITVILNWKPKRVDR